jgi:hypothetical protein
MTARERAGGLADQLLREGKVRAYAKRKFEEIQADRAGKPKRRGGKGPGARRGTKKRKGYKAGKRS